MDTQRALARLNAHRKAIGDALNDGQVLLGYGDATQFKALGLVRWQLLRGLRSYQLFKHTELFNPIISAGDPARRSKAVELKARCIAAGEAYQKHVMYWSLSGPAHDWARYVTETEAVIAQLKEHLHHEAEATIKLLDGLDRTRRGL